MKYVHTITFSVFAAEGEDEDKIKNAIVSLIPFDLEKEKIKLKRTVAEGIEKKIIILEAVLEKERHTTKFIEQLREKLGREQRSLIVSQENRVDGECFFYMRLDKSSLIEGRYVLTDAGDCIHMKMSVAAFPKKRESAILVVKKIFEAK